MIHERNWHIGCSGFYYKEWKDVFYPKGLPQKQWFEYYCRFFNTIEINNTFYRFPELTALRSWYNRSPGNFLFAVKAPKIITHEQQFNGSGEMLAELYSVIAEGFAEKTGPLLFQLPPHVAYSSEKLEAIISQLNPAFTNVIEFRHASWWRPDVYTRLGKAGVVFCSVSYPDLSNDVIRNGETVYYRFHGLPKLYFSDYSNDFLQQVFRLIDEDKKAKTAFLYFNNTAAAGALANAKYMQELAQRPNYLL